MPAHWFRHARRSGRQLHVMFVKHKWVIVRLSTQDALRLSFAHTAGAFPESGCCALICSHQEVIKQLYAYIHAYIYIYILLLIHENPAEDIFITDW